MPKDTASNVVWSIQSASQGYKDIEKLVDYSVNDESSTDTHNEVGNDEPAGFIRKPGKKAISFTQRLEKGIRQSIDWDYLADSGETFALVFQIVGGRRTQYPICHVSKVDIDGDADGEHKMKIEIVSRSRKKL